LFGFDEWFVRFDSSIPLNYQNHIAGIANGPRKTRYVPWPSATKEITTCFRSAHAAPRK
jgi:hypothetical protein